MNKAVNEVLPSLEAQLVREGADPVGGTPQQFAPVRAEGVREVAHGACGSPGDRGVIAPPSRCAS